MKSLSVLVMTLLATLALSGVAVAKGNAAANAQSSGDGFVAALMPAADGSTQGQGICNTKTQSGFFAKNASYLASCSSADGTFQAIYIVDGNHKSLKTNSPYVKAQLNTVCATGHAYSVGVKQKFVALYLGTLGAARPSPRTCGICSPVRSRNRLRAS
jgi:hypothetical protein